MGHAPTPLTGPDLVVVGIYRDQESRRAEALLEQGDQAGLEALLATVRG